MMIEGQNSGRPPQMMSFKDAVTNVIINNYMNFSGRASRSEYWFFTLFSFILGIITFVIDGVIFGWEYYEPAWVGDITSIALFLPSLGVWIRRLHDVGRSGWWTLIAFTIIGLIPLFIWSVTDSEEHPNQYGEIPTNTIQNNTNIYDNY